MPFLQSLFTLFSIFCSSTTTYAVKIPFEVSPRSFEFGTGLGRRQSVSNNTLPLKNIANAQYIANVTIADTTARVLLDTGSSDLWVSFPDTVPQTADTGTQVSLAYAIGGISGNVHKAKTSFATHTVDDQAFILVTDTSSFATDIHIQGYDGLMGLGPNEGSEIQDKLDEEGNTFLHNIFSQSRNTQSYITILLDRKADPSDPFTGQFTISEVVPQFSNITSMPKLDVEEVYALLDSQQHWQVLTDKDVGLTGPDGKIIASDSIVPRAPDGQMVAVLDSGFTLSQVPRDVADAIYGRVKGAKYDVKQEYWTVPCGQLLNISFKFGEHDFPIHPLDVVDDNFNLKDENGNHVCLGSFQPITTAFSIFGNFDMILGMNFMRNAYTLFDFGDWISDDSQDDPYIQMLPLTDAAQARQDFIDIRLNGVDTTGDEQWQLLPEDQMQHSPVSDEEKKKKYQEMILSRWPYILAGCLVAVLLIIGFCIWRCCCRKGRKKGKKMSEFGGMGGKKGADMSSSYLPLQAPVAGHSSSSLSQYSGSQHHLPQGGGDYGGHHHHHTGY